MLQPLRLLILITDIDHKEVILNLDFWIRGQILAGAPIQVDKKY